MACVRILIADDHETVRQGLRALLASRPAWEVCGEDADGIEAIEKAAQLRPGIVQESLTNIHRHSGSKTATVRIARTAGRLSLEIEDQGCGIPADKLREIQTQGSGVGIAGMRERVLHFNGDIRISSLSTGTRIAVSFPIEPGSRTPEPVVLNS
jgi:signal transduction histidine kinase